MSARRRAIGFWAVAGGIWLVVAVIAWLSPLQGEDWQPAGWISRHGASPAALTTYTLRNHIFGDLVELLLVLVRPAHVLLSPTAVIAMLVALVTLALGRVPRPSDRHAALLLALASTFLFIGAPRVGADLFHRNNVALFVYGFTALLWLVVIYRHAGDAPRGGTGRAIAVGALGLVAGTSNHHVVPIVIVAVWCWIRARRRDGRAVPAWMWSGLGGLVVGAVLLFTDRPYLHPQTFLRAGFEHNLYRFYLFMTKGGQLVALMLLVFFALLVKAQLRPPAAPSPSPRDVRIAGWAFGMGFLAAGIGLLMPRWGEPAMLAPTAMLAIGALALMLAPLDDPWLRRAMIGLAVVIHVVVVVFAVPRYIDAHQTYLEREAALVAAPKGGIARVPAYDLTEPDFWFLGEDLGSASIRGQVAWFYGLRGIIMTTPFSGYEPSPDLHFVEVLTSTAGQVERIPLLADDLEVARAMFREDLIERRHGAWDGTGELEMTELPWSGLHGRRVIASRFFDHHMADPSFEVTPIDRSLRMSVIVDPDSLEGDYPLAYLLAHGADERAMSIDGDRHWFRPQQAEQVIFLRCNPTECVAVTTAWSQL